MRTVTQSVSLTGTSPALVTFSFDLWQSLNANLGKSSIVVGPAIKVECHVCPTMSCMHSSCCRQFRGMLKVQHYWSPGRDRLNVALGRTLGFITPPNNRPTVRWLITPPPLPSAHRWDVRLKVDGEQRGVWCCTPSYRLEFGLETAPLSTCTLLTRMICILQVSFHCCRRHLSL